MSTDLPIKAQISFPRRSGFPARTAIKRKHTRASRAPKTETRNPTPATPPIIVISCDVSILLGFGSRCWSRSVCELLTVVSGFAVLMVMVVVVVVSERHGRDVAYKVFLEQSVVIALSALFVEL